MYIILYYSFVGKQKTKDFIIEILESFLSSFVVLMVIYFFIALPEIVSGASMEPTLFDSERIIVEKISKWFMEYKRGDIVVFHPPGDDTIDYVKRIVGVPGDIVKISDCKVYITRENERYLLEEEYLVDDTCTYGGTSIQDSRATRLEDDEFLVLGDNRTRSADSRVFGLIRSDRIVGKAIFRFWPFPAAGFL